MKIESISKEDYYLYIFQANLRDFVAISEYPEEEVLFQEDGDSFKVARKIHMYIDLGQIQKRFANATIIV